LSSQPPPINIGINEKDARDCQRPEPAGRHHTLCRDHPQLSLERDKTDVQHRCTRCSWRGTPEWAAVRPGGPDASVRWAIPRIVVHGSQTVVGADAPSAKSAGMVRILVMKTRELLAHAARGLFAVADKTSDRPRLTC
jgi:hypothetical protein